MHPKNTEFIQTDVKLLSENVISKLCISMKGYMNFRSFSIPKLMWINWIKKTLEGHLKISRGCILRICKKAIECEKLISWKWFLKISFTSCIFVRLIKSQLHLEKLNDWQSWSPVIQIFLLKSFIKSICGDKYFLVKHNMIVLKVTGTMPVEVKRLTFGKFIPKI